MLFDKSAINWSITFHSSSFYETPQSTLLKAIVLPGAVASAVAQRPPILPVLSH